MNKSKERRLGPQDKSRDFSFSAATGLTKLLGWCSLSLADLSGRELPAELPASRWTSLQWFAVTGERKTGAPTTAMPAAQLLQRRLQGTGLQRRSQAIA